MQLAGMLLQGKFRELAVSLGLGGLSADGTRLDADIDRFNPNHPITAPFHLLGEVLPNFIFGRQTNPYNVAYRSSWECK